VTGRSWLPVANFDRFGSLDTAAAPGDAKGLDGRRAAVRAPAAAVCNVTFHGAVG
jgi:hypothetical protein